MQSKLLLQNLWVLFACTGISTLAIALGVKIGFRRGKGVKDL